MRNTTIIHEKRKLSRMQEEGLIELFRGSFKLPDPERLHAVCPQF